MRTRQPGPARFKPSLLALALLVLTLAGCAGKGEPEQVDEPVDKLYNQALDQLKNGDPKEAAKSFEEVDRQHPYSQWATRGQMMAAYAYYEANEYDEAVAAAERFIELHPGHKDVALRLLPDRHLLLRADLGRRPRPGDDRRRRSDAFSELIRRFPDSDYARDAQLKVDLIRDHLAGKEMEIGRYYQRRRQVRRGDQPLSAP